jgi:preprotein translocase subunit SecF
VQFHFLHNTNIDFIGKRYIFFAVSATLAIIGLASLIIRGGPNYSIDFTGGILVEASCAQQVGLDDVRSALRAGGVEKLELQSLGKDIIIRAKQQDINQDEFSKKILLILRQKFPQNQIAINRTEYVGPAVGKHLAKQAFNALIFSFLGIIIYVAFRFHSSIWGVAGVFGIVHDVFVVFGLFSLFNLEINLTSIAAFLTIAGYSINDTIVVFDRLRENLRYITKEDFATVINRSVNQTLARTIITSLTVFMVALALFFLGGEVIHDFALAMLLGVVIGTYSSIYVCTPLVFEWEQYKRRRTAKFSKPVKK